MVFCVVLCYGFCLSSSCVFCAHFCQCPLRFSPTFNQDTIGGLSEAVNGRSTDTTLAERKDQQWYKRHHAYIIKDWSQFLFGSRRNNLNQVAHTVYYVRVCTTWLRLFRMNRTNNFDQSLYINSNFFCYNIEKYIYFFKIRQIIGSKIK